MFRDQFKIHLGFDKCKDGTQHRHASLWERKSPSKLAQVSTKCTICSQTFMDCIHLTGIRCYGYTGYLPEEQLLGQWFEVDVRLWLDISTAAKTDAIEDTLDYRSVINLIQHLVKTSKFALIEKLVTTIADSILQECDRVTQVQVILSKPAAPIPDFGGKISIELTKSKSNL